MNITLSFDMKILNSQFPLKTKIKKPKKGCVILIA